MATLLMGIVIENRYFKIGNRDNRQFGPTENPRSVIRPAFDDRQDDICDIDVNEEIPDDWFGSTSQPSIPLDPAVEEQNASLFWIVLCMDGFAAGFYLPWLSRRFYTSHIKTVIFFTANSFSICFAPFIQTKLDHSCQSTDASRSLKPFAMN